VHRLPYIGQQLPVYSPLSGIALARASYALLSGDASAHAELRAIINERFAADEIILFDSGRSALQVAIRVAGRMVSSARATTVALPAFQCFEVASAAVGSGANVSFYDVEPETLGPDLASLERALSNGANVVVIAPLYGIPVDWNATADLIARFGAIAIEDAAQGIGGEWRGRKLGTLGQITVLSFGRGKGWTGGGGGALCLRGASGSGPSAVLHSQSVSAQWRILTSTWAQWMAGRPAIYGVPARLPWLGLGETHYHKPTMERRMTRFSAELLLRTADASDREAQSMRERGDFWQRRLAHGTIRLVSLKSDARPGYLRFPFRVTDPAMRHVMHRAAAVRLGIAPSYPLPLHKLPVPALASSVSRTYSGAQTLSEQLFTLPTHSLLTVRDCLAIERLLLPSMRAVV